jgi:hypothetical protein
MTVIRLLLGGAHLLLAVGGIAFYFSPSFAAGALIVSGVFVRWMVPYGKGEPQKSARNPIIGGVIGGMVGYWLSQNGLGDFIGKVWSDRFSLVPIIAFTALLVWLTLSDWNRVLKLTGREVEGFYKTP